MKFFDYLLNDLNSYLLDGTEKSKEQQSNNFVFGQNLIKKPDRSVAIIELHDFSDAVNFVRFVSGNRSAVINFNALNAAETVRAVDFVSGAVCALGGTMQEISKGIYLFAPTCTKLKNNKRKTKNK